MTGHRWESLCPLQSYLPGSPAHPWPPHPGSTTLHTGREIAEISHNIHSYQWPCINLWELNFFGWKCRIVPTPANLYSTNIPHSYMVIYVKLGNTYGKMSQCCWCHSRDMSMSTAQKHEQTTHTKTEVLCCPLLTQSLLSLFLFDLEIKEAMLWPLIS